MEKRQIVVYRSIVVLKCLFIAAMFLSAVPFIHVAFSQYIKVLLALGFALLLADVVCGRGIYQAKYLIFLIAFIMAYLVTIILNRQDFLTENMKAWLYMIVIFLLFYGYNRKLRRETLRREIRIVSLVYHVCAFLVSAVCLYTYVFSVNLKYTVDQAIMHIGMFDNRLWGLYNPNTGATIAVVSIVLTLAALLERRKGHRAARVFYGVNLGLQSIVLILTGSRAALVVAYISAAALLAVYISRKFGRRAALPAKSRRTRKVTGGILSFLILIVVFEGVNQGAKYGLSYVPSALSDAGVGDSAVIKASGRALTEAIERAAAVEKQKGTTGRRIDLARKETEEDRAGGLLTGRTDLWAAGFKAFTKQPIFGTARENLYDACVDYLPHQIWEGSLYTGGLHNILLTVLVSSGLVGFLILAAFVVLSLKRMLAHGFKKRAFLEDPQFLGLFLLILSFGIMEMLEARILYRVGLFYVVFWIFYGYAVHLTDTDETKRS